MIRQIGNITYTLTAKKVKNINLRVRLDGSVCVSAHKKVPLSKIDEFVLSKAGWIEKAKGRIDSKGFLTCDFSSEECLAVFEPICDKIYPLFADTIQNKPPIKLRQMKSCWGVCHIKKGTITLNKALLSKPLPAIEYVILHEYLHFLEPNHGKNFHQYMSELMPDYKQRRKLLK